MLFRLNFGDHMEQDGTVYHAGDIIKTDVDLAKKLRIRDIPRKLFKFTRVDVDDLDDFRAEVEDESQGGQYDAERKGKGQHWRKKTDSELIGDVAVNLEDDDDPNAVGAKV